MCIMHTFSFASKPNRISFGSKATGKFTCTIKIHAFWKESETCSSESIIGLIYIHRNTSVNERLMTHLSNKDSWPTWITKTQSMSLHTQRETSISDSGKVKPSLNLFKTFPIDSTPFYFYLISNINGKSAIKIPLWYNSTRFSNIFLYEYS